MTYTILVIQAYKNSLVKVVQKLSKEHSELGTPRIVLLTSEPGKYEKYSDMEVISTDYSNESLTKIFSSLSDEVKGIVCRGDKHIQYLRRIVSYLSPDVRVASENSLRIATSKRLMRQAFYENYPEITPGFVRVKNVTPDTISALEEKLAFPVIIKPTSLASSLLIQRCNNRIDLIKGLEYAFTRIFDIYRQEGRHEEPEIIVEEFMEGDFYSVDSYVQEHGEVTHCPLISYVPAEKLGIDDFFLYKRTAPPQLDAGDVSDAEEAAKKAILAAKLTHSSVHIELVKTSSGWKIIEIGPRIGRFRNIMYREVYGFDHEYNDLLIHLGIPPEVSHLPVKHCAAYSIYPSSEGTLERVEGIEKVRQLHSLLYFKLLASKGELVRHAKNGGHALCEVIFADSDEVTFSNDTSWFEKNVFAVVNEKEI